jgi:hypothetical protein
MHDIIEIIKNLQTLTTDDNAFKIIKDFERVIDELDVYVFKNWEDGELLSGPMVGRYDVTCTFMWPRNSMPDPEGAVRLGQYGCQISYQKTNILIPRKVYKPSDFRPGTKKGKIDAHPIWIVSICMPKKLMQNIYQGNKEKENNRLADLMKYDSPAALTPDKVAGEPQLEPSNNAPEPPPTPTPI